MTECLGTNDKGGELLRCIHCRGEMKRGTAPVHIDRDGCHLALDRVPAWVCGQCAEAYFEEKEVEAIQDLVRSLEEKAEGLARKA